MSRSIKREDVGSLIYLESQEDLKRQSLSDDEWWNELSEDTLCPACQCLDPRLFEQSATQMILRSVPKGCLYCSLGFTAIRNDLLSILEQSAGSLITLPCLLRHRGTLVPLEGFTAVLARQRRPFIYSGPGAICALCRQCNNLRSGGHSGGNEWAVLRADLDERDVYFDTPLVTDTLWKKIDWSSYGKIKFFHCSVVDQLPWPVTINEE